MITLESLYSDHNNLIKILCLLEQSLVDICRGTSQNYLMLQRILVYIQNYPERLHHPAEDAMFSVILNNNSCDKHLHKDISALLKDHSEIENITRDAIEAVESVLNSTHSDMPRIARHVSTVITRQREHILFEEINIYPRITDYLTAEDWNKVSDLIPYMNDPVFGSESETGKKYEIILQALSRNSVQ